MRFATRSGVLAADARRRTARSPWTSPPPRSPRSTAPDGRRRRRWAPSRSPAYDTGPNIGDLLVELADEKTVRALAPDLAALAACSERGVIATARAEDPSRGYDFVSRCFFPNVGIDEDPVTGSAHTALAPFWSDRLGRADLTGLQASARSGLVRTALRGDRTLLTGTRSPSSTANC